MLLEIPKIVDLCVINRVESENISCLRMHDLLLSLSNSFNKHFVRRYFMKIRCFTHKLLSYDQ